MGEQAVHDAEAEDHLYTSTDTGFGEAHDCVVHLLPCLTLQPPHIRDYYASPLTWMQPPKTTMAHQAQPLAIGLDVFTNLDVDPRS